MSDSTRAPQPSPEMLAMIAVLRQLPGIKDAPDETPETPLGEYPQIIFYEDPGVWTPAGHRDRHNRLMWDGRHTALFVYLDQPPDDWTAMAQATAMLRQMAGALASAFDRDHFGGTVEALYRMESTGYDWVGNNEDKRFVAILSVEYGMPLAIDAGKFE